MPVKILVPVLPSERFDDAVVAAADLVAERGGTITFLFTTIRPPPMWIEKQPSQSETLDAEVAPERGDAQELDAWQDEMRQALEDARQLLFERGISEEQVSYSFADFETTPAQAVADEAAAGGYDYVVLARGEFVELPADMPGEAPVDVARAVQELEDEGVRLVVA